jgi:hypothetical protein
VFSNNRHVKLVERVHARRQIGTWLFRHSGNVWSRYTCMIANNLRTKGRPVESQDGCFDSGSETPTDFVIGCETRNKRRSCSRINNCRVSSSNIPAAIGCLKPTLGVLCGRAWRPRDAHLSVLKAGSSRGASVIQACHLRPGWHMSLAFLDDAW